MRNANTDKGPETSLELITPVEEASARGHEIFQQRIITCAPSNRLQSERYRRPREISEDAGHSLRTRESESCTCSAQIKN